MSSLRNAMRGQAVLAMGAQPARLGVVTGYDPASYSVKVTFPPDTTETGWIPLGALAVGTGWGVYAGPVIGDQIEVDFQDGAGDAGKAGLRMPDNDHMPPPVLSGEIWLIHKSGAFFKLTNDAKATFSDAHGASVALNGDGTITSAGTWTHQGSLVVKQNLEVDGSTQVKAISSNGHDISNSHGHTLVEPGSGTSGPVK